MTPQDLRRARDGAFDRDYVRPTSGYGAHSFWTFSYLSYALVHTHSQVTRRRARPRARQPAAPALPPLIELHVTEFRLRRLVPFTCDMR